MSRVVTRKVGNPYTLCRDEKLKRLKEEVCESVRRRNEKMETMIEKMRLRCRRYCLDEEVEMLRYILQLLTYTCIHIE